MPQLKHVSCSVQWADTSAPFHEYGTAYGDGVVETFIVVPNNPQPFNIKIKSRNFIHEGLSAIIFVDGNYQTNRTRVNLVPTRKGQPLNRTEVDFLVRSKEKPLGEGMFMSRERRFDNHNVVPELPQGVKEHHFDNLGKIEVFILRCRARLDADAAGSPISSAADSDVLNNRHNSSTSSEADDNRHEKFKVTQQEELNGFDLFDLFGGDGTNDNTHRFGMDGYIPYTGPQWPPQPSYSYQYHPVHDPQANGPPYQQYPPFMPPDTHTEQYQWPRSPTDHAKRHVRFENGSQDLREARKESLGSPTHARPSSQERRRPSGGHGYPNPYVTLNQSPRYSFSQLPQYQTFEQPAHQYYNGPPQSTSVRFPPHTNASTMLGSITGGHLNQQPMPFPPNIPQCPPQPPYYSYHPVHPSWPPYQGAGYDPRSAVHYNGQVFHPGHGWFVRPSTDPRAQSQSAGVENPPIGTQNGADVNANVQATNSPYQQDNTQPNGQYVATNILENSGNTYSPENRNQAPVDGYGGVPNDESWNQGQDQTASNGNKQTDWNNTGQNNESGDGNGWGSPDPNTSNNNPTTFAVQQESGVRPLFGPHGQYYTWSAQGPDVAKPDAEEEPRYDVPLSIAQAKGSTKQVQPGQGYLYYKKRCSPEYIDTLAEPYARFVFEYRTKDQIKNELGIDIPVEPTGDAAMQELQNMDKQTLVDMLLRAKSALGGRIPSPPPKVSPSLSHSPNRAPVPVEPPIQEFLNYHISTAPRLNSGEANGTSTNNLSQAGQNDNDWGGGGGGGGGGGNDNSWGSNNTNNDWNGNAATTEANPNANWNREEPQQNGTGWDGAHGNFVRKPSAATPAHYQQPATITHHSLNHSIMNVNANPSNIVPITISPSSRGNSPPRGAYSLASSPMSNRPPAPFTSQSWNPNESAQHSGQKW